MSNSAYITFRKIMSFRNPCHMPFCNFIPPFTLTEITKGVYVLLKLSPKRPKITFWLTSLQQKFEEKGKSNFAHFANDEFFAAANSCKIGNRNKIATRITLRIQTPLNGPEGAWFVAIDLCNCVRSRVAIIRDSQRDTS